MDYRNYLELEVEVFRGADGWLRAESGALSKVKRSVQFTSILLMVVQSWEEAAVFAVKDNRAMSFAYSWMKLHVLDGKSISTLFELCERLDMQLLIAAPENISPEKGTTYKLVRKLPATKNKFMWLVLRGFGATE